MLLNHAGVTSGLLCHSHLRQRLAHSVRTHLRKTTHKSRAISARAQQTAVRTPPGLQTIPWNGTPEEEQASSLRRLRHSYLFTSVYSLAAHELPCQSHISPHEDVAGTVDTHVDFKMS